MVISASGNSEDLGIVDVPITSPSIPRDTGMPAMIIGDPSRDMVVPLIAMSLGGTFHAGLAAVMVLPGSRVPSA